MALYDLRFRREALRLTAKMERLVIKIPKDSQR